MAPQGNPMWRNIKEAIGRCQPLTRNQHPVPPARDDGLSFEAGRPPGESVAAGIAIAFLILVFCLYPARGVLALIFLIATIALMA